MKNVPRTTFGYGLRRWSVEADPGDRLLLAEHYQGEEFEAHVRGRH